MAILNFDFRFSSVILIILPLFVIGCSEQKKSSVKDNVLVYCSEGSPETFNPQLSTSGTTFDASSRTIYNRLVEFKPGSSFIQPALATDWEISEDGTEYTFNLRKNVVFHSNDHFQPTRLFNADDVIFSFTRQLSKQNPYHSISKLNYGYFYSMGLDNLILSIDKLDSHRVRFKLSHSESPFLATLAMDFASILSAEYADNMLALQQPELVDSHPVGTGPYRLTRYQPDAYIRYVAHEFYWQGKQKLEHLVYAITPNPSLRFARMVAGECDIMANPLPTHISTAKSQKNMTVLSEPGLNVAYLSLNTLKPPFDNVQVRLALNHAINKDSIIRAVYQKTATAAKSPIPPSMWAYDKELLDQTYDPMLAKQMLADAGFPQGFKMSIWTMSAQRAYNPNAKKMAELIQQDFRKIGVTVEISTYEYGTFLSKTRKGQHHAALMGWISDNGDPDNFFTPLLSCAATGSGTNSAFWCNPDFDSLIQQARAKNTIKNRLRLYNSAQRIFKEESPWVPIAHATQHIIINPRVKNFKIIPAGGVYFTGVYLENSIRTDSQ